MITGLKNRQEILEEFRNVCIKVENLQKRANEIFGENDPYSDILSLADSYLIDPLLDLEEKQHYGKCNKLEKKTLEQILDLLNRIRWYGPKSLQDLTDAYRIMKKAVAKDFEVTENTIHCACTRRLQLDYSNFLSLVHEWLNGNPRLLIEVLKVHTYEFHHVHIHKFFK